MKPLPIKDTDEEGNSNFNLDSHDIDDQEDFSELPTVKDGKSNTFLSRLAVLVIIVCVLLLSFVILNKNQKNETSSSLKISKTFDVSSLDVKSTPYDSHIPEVYTLNALCNQTVWQSELYLNCTMVYGGTFNVVNAIVVCLRWAIDAGMGLIMPRIGTRSKTDPKIWEDTVRDLTYLFDKDLFLQTLHQECPQLVIQEHDYNVTNRIQAESIIWKQYTGGTYRSHIFDLLTYNNIVASKNSTAVMETNPSFGWKFNKERFNIHRSLLKMLSFAPNLRTLATIVAKKLQPRYIGFHLRAESDWPWDNYENTVSWFEELRHDDFSDLDMVYVAAGSQDLVDKFSNRLKAQNINVVSKWSLVAENSTLLAEMKDLRFDQLAVIDYEILMQSSHFFGVAQSSFSYAIARERGNGYISQCNCHLFEDPDFRFVCCT
jgi:hypothetical protein